MTTEPISDARFEEIFQGLLNDPSGDNLRAALGELPPDGEVLLRRTLFHMIQMLHAGELEHISGLPVFRAYMDHYFPDGNVPSKEALIELMRPDAKRIQAIAEAEFASCVRLGLIRGPGAIAGHARPRGGCSGVIAIAGLLLIGVVLLLSMAK